MFQLKNMIYIHNTSRPTTKQPEPDYNTGTIMSERYDAQKNTNVAVSDTVAGWNVSCFHYPYQ